MNSHDLADILYVGIIPIAAGVLAILLNNRVLGKKPGEDYKWDDWHNNYSKIIKWAGPIMVAAGTIRIAGILIKN